MMTTMPNKHYGGDRKATGEESDQNHLEKRSKERNVDNRYQVQLKEA